MSSGPRTATRIVIVGGGIAGLSIAARLAQSGLPVTLLERCDLGGGATTQNLGWLLSGALFARDDPQLAQLYLKALEQTLRFAPDCVEPNTDPMVYLLESGTEQAAAWTDAWSRAGIPFSPLAPDVLFARFPDIALARAKLAFELPDRAIRMDVLLQNLAAVATAFGAEIRMGVTCVRLVRDAAAVTGVETAHGETIAARLVVVAANANNLIPGFGAEPPGTQPAATFVTLQTHLLAMRPAIGRTPLCVLDAGGFNHLPHLPFSVFGSHRWRVARGHDPSPDPNEFERIREQILKLFPDVLRRGVTFVEWAGTTVQAMQPDQIEPGREPRPVVIDHQFDGGALANLVSVYPGRASLWPIVAEDTLQLVLRKLERIPGRIAIPPWGKVLTRPESNGRQPGNGTPEHDGTAEPVPPLTNV